MYLAGEYVKDSSEAVKELQEKRQAVENIKATMRIQIARGNKDAAWILNHL